METSLTGKAVKQGDVKILDKDMEVFRDEMLAAMAADKMNFTAAKLEELKTKTLDTLKLPKTAVEKGLLELSMTQETYFSRRPGKILLRSRISSRRIR